ncbi:MAG: hypothetical protein JRJ87_26465 [Deltaproteobacteria bacterium]|nr:hypothetical protein [Deltaproteobacteria bacterium]
MKKILIIAVILAVLGGGFFVYLQITKMDRYLEEAISTGYISLDEADYLADYMDDPRVREVFRKRLISIHGNIGSEKHPKHRPIFDRAFSSHKLKVDDEVGKALMRVMFIHDYMGAKNWVEDYETNPKMTIALTNQLKYASSDYLGMLIGELEARKVKVTNDLVKYVVAASMSHGESKEGQAYLKKGFPKNGDVLTLSGDSVDPNNDPRISEGYAYLFARKSFPKMEEWLFDRLHARLLKHPPEITEEYLNGLVRAMQAQPVPRVVGLARALGPLGAQRLRKFASSLERSEDKAAAAKLLAALGSGSLEDVDPILNDLKDQLMRHDHDADDRKKLVAQAGASLAAFGPKIIPRLIKEMNGDNGHVGAAAATALAELDPVLLAKELVRQIEAKNKKWGYGVAIEKLVEAPASPEIDRFYELMVPTVPEDAVKALAERLDGPRFVSALFVNMPRKQKYDPQEILIYSSALNQKKGAAPQVARQLEHELKIAGGKPDRVFWLVKLLALEKLGQNGGPETKALVQKFVGDKGYYVDVRTTIDSRSGSEIDSQSDTHTFATLAYKALKKIEAREGGK